MTKDLKYISFVRLLFAERSRQDRLSDPGAPNAEQVVSI